MKILIIIIMLSMSLVASAERNKSELQTMPSYLKGIESNGKLLRHGYILWLEKRPYSAITNSELSKKGSVIYAKHCMECHGAKGAGEGPVAKKYGVKPANILNSQKLLNTHALFIQIAEGRGDMPQWVDVLTEEEMWALTNYLQSLK